MKARYNRPMIVISQYKGGSYVLAEMDGSVFQQKVGAFRVIPYFARQKLEIPHDILEIIDILKNGLEKFKSAEDNIEAPDKDFGFEGVNVRNEEVDFSDEEEIN